VRDWPDAEDWPWLRVLHGLLADAAIEPADRRAALWRNVEGTLVALDLPVAVHDDAVERLYAVLYGLRPGLDTATPDGG